ncbi:hypothetical protein N7450_002898 [Penicillium hetheringtonii]|uniref:CID domain-containing protein n=1 Tax=Penicillium hetheringtonii TaxID=911720 RepID=A0AAD6GZ40_9EURO|nr:hypothetical protein N7450_002898 [Penicillium hetheringtonii]
MAYTDDAVKAKLSALNETQESIVTVAQWVMFHRRHADRTAQIWLQKVRDSPPPKRLNLVYLANEVAQQSKARGRDEFLIAFAPIIAEASATAYKGTSVDIQGKLRRVIEVWRQRNVFEGPILDAVEARVNEIDKNRFTTKKQPLGGSFFKDSSTAMSSSTSTTTATVESEKLLNPEDQPSPPVHAARLTALLKTLANAESSVSEVIKSRKALIDGLEKLLATNRAELTKEESVEDAIVRDLSYENSGGPQPGGDGAEYARPEVEALTPPPVEALTPVGSPKPEQPQASHGPFTSEPSVSLPEGLVIPNVGQPDNNIPYPDSSSVSPGGGNDFDLSTNGAAKRRKVVHGEEDYAQFANEDLDADVAKLIAEQGR